MKFCQLLWKTHLTNYVLKSHLDVHWLRGGQTSLTPVGFNAKKEMSHLREAPREEPSYKGRLFEVILKYLKFSVILLFVANRRGRA
jgi:hypothetical protein